jgi:hypothetical protein
VHYDNSHDNYCRTRLCTLVATHLGSYRKLSQISYGLSIGDCNPTIIPLLMCLDPDGSSSPTVAGNCALVIPPSKSTDKGLKMSALGSFEMCQKDFPGSDLMMARESQMCPPQLSHLQWLRNVPKMISS